MPEFSQLLELLRQVVVKSENLRLLVPKFQAAVWHSAIPFPSEAAENALRDLAYDLEYYDPDPKNRAADSSFFDDDRAIAEIRSTLAMLESNENAMNLECSDK